MEVPKYGGDNSPQIQPRGFEGRQQIATNEDMFGGARAKQLAKGSRDMGQLAQSTDNIFKAIDADDKTAQLLELEKAVNDWEQQNILDPNNGALSRRGGDAKGIAGQTLGKFEQWIQKKGATANSREIPALGSDRIALKRAEFLASRRRAMRGSLARHEASELKVYKEALLASGLKDTARRMTTYYNNESEITRGVSQIKSKVRELAKSQGFGGDLDYIAQQQQIAVSAAHVDVIKRFMANNDLAGAKKYMEEKKAMKELQGTEALALEKLVNGETDKAEAEDLATRTYTNPVAIDNAPSLETQLKAVQTLGDKKGWDQAKIDEAKKRLKAKFNEALAGQRVEETMAKQNLIKAAMAGDPLDPGDMMKVTTGPFLQAVQELAGRVQTRRKRGAPAGTSEVDLPETESYLDGLVGNKTLHTTFNSAEDLAVWAVTKQTYKVNGVEREIQNNLTTKTIEKYQAIWRKEKGVQTKEDLKWDGPIAVSATINQFANKYIKGSSTGTLQTAFKTEVNREMREFIATAQRKPKAEELERIMKGLVVRIDRAFWTDDKNFLSTEYLGDDKPGILGVPKQHISNIAYMVQDAKGFTTEEKITDKWLELKLKADRMSEEHRKQITDTLRKHNHEVTEDNIKGLWLETVFRGGIPP